MTFTNDISDIAARARVRNERAFKEATEHLEAAEQPFIAAHLAFALLHMLLAVTRSELIKNGFSASLSAMNAEICLHVPPRQAMCRFLLHETQIEMLLIHEVSGEVSRKMWQPPPVVDQVLLFDAIQGLTKEIAQFLTGGDCP